MRDRKLDRHFDRFRKRGDTNALAKVFDATAPELLGLAVHLVRDVGEGEDLLQQTFLTAIEKADRYDASRRLLPWLVGILVRHAHAARRKKSRPTDELQADLVGGSSPTGQVEERELADSVMDALSQLPANYRDVLEPYLLRGERAVDIARSNGKSPGTVRVQIRRGLDELRRALPAGLAAGASLLTGGQSLAAVRAAILERASKVVSANASLGAASVSSTTLLGGLAMSNKIVLGAVALTLLSFIGWIAQRDQAPEMTALVEDTRELSPTEDSRLGAALPAVDMPSSTDFTESSERAAVDEIELARADELEAFLSGASGRIVDEHGIAVAGISVRLLELRAGMIDSFVGAPFQSDIEKKLRDLVMNPLVAESITNERGEFDLWGADPSATHAIGIDLGGQRPTLRVVDQGLDVDERADLGTIRLDPVRVLRGRVTDGRGLPVEGARVRAGSFPEPTHGLAEVRGRGWLLVQNRRSGGMALAIPPLATSWIDLLPIPRTETAKDGSFELRGVSQNSVEVFIDHPEHGLRVETVGRDGLGLGTVAFAAKKSYSGRVLDSSGLPVAGVEVLYGGLRAFGNSSSSLTVARGLLRTEADGSFQFDCSGSPIVFARRNDRESWQSSPKFEDEGTITLQALFERSITLVDREGSPVVGAQIHLSAMSNFQSLYAALGNAPEHGEVVELENGEYQISGLLEGAHQLLVRANGFALLEATIEAKAGATPAEFVLDRSGPRTAKVIDAQSKQAIAGVSALIQSANANLSYQARGTSNADGSIVFTDLPIEGEGEFSILLQHPSYAPRRLALSADPSETTEVELHANNDALFRVSVSGSVPVERLMIVLEADEAFGLNRVFPLMELTDERGQALFTGLAEGEWEYEVLERFLHLDALSLIDVDPPDSLAKGRFTIVGGRPQTIDVEVNGAELKSVPVANMGSVEGLITVEGVEGLKLQVGLYKEGERELERDWIAVSASGQYRFDDLRPGAYRLFVMDGILGQGSFDIIAMPEVSIQPGRGMRKDIALRGFASELEVVDDAGEPVTDARLQIFPKDESTQSNALPRPTGDGRWTLFTWKEGEYIVILKSPTKGLGGATLELKEQAGELNRIVCSRGVMCAGDLYLPQGMTSAKGWMSVSSMSNNMFGSNQVAVEFINGRASFEVIGMQAGRISAVVHLENGTMHREILELPEGGDSAIEIHCSQMDGSSGPAPAPPAPADGGE